jgi:sugar lactone lactonase YvrE
MCWKSRRMACSRRSNTNDWTGALIRIAPDGTRTELVPGVLTAPGGVAVGSDGTLYVTNNSIYSNSGEVIRIRQ